MPENFYSPILIIYSIIPERLPTILALIPDKITTIISCIALSLVAAWLARLIITIKADHACRKKSCLHAELWVGLSLLMHEYACAYIASDARVL